MNFWRASLGVAGLGGVAFFVFYGLYKKWLDLPIFRQLDAHQTFVLMLVFLFLTFVALVVGLIAYSRRRSPAENEDAALHRLEQSWHDVNNIDCARLVGPDVNRAANALEMTSVYWRNRYIQRGVLLQKYERPFIDLFEQLDNCDKVVPGYEKLKQRRCRDFISPLVRETYREIRGDANADTRRA